MIIVALRTLMLAESSIASRLGDRIYPVQTPDAPEYPCAVLTKVTGMGSYDMQGDAGVEASRVQLDLYDDQGVMEMLELKQACRRFLSGFKGGVEGNPCQIQSVFVITDTDLTAPETERAGPRVRRRMLEFLIWSREV